MSICQSIFINHHRAPPSDAAWAEAQSARGLHSCGPVQGSSRRSVTATLQFARQRGRTLVRTKSKHDNNLYKLSPEILRWTTRIQVLAVRVFHSFVTLGCRRSPCHVGSPVPADAAIVESVKLPANDAIIIARWILHPDSTRIDPLPCRRAVSGCGGHFVG